MFFHLSPYCALAVGGGKLTQKLMLTYCPTPTGLGATLQKEYVGMCHAGVCALVKGTTTIEAAIANIRNTAIAIFVALVFKNVIFLFSFFYFAISLLL